MHSHTFDVVVVGAGAAGITAAIGLARSGFAVAVVEAAPFPGAENWSGCVYFAENLAHPDILGPDGVEELAWERRLVERGLFATDGHGLLGMTYRDTAAFRHCYTVLRPIYDYHLAQRAQRLGVAILNGTTAESLLRDNDRVIGVCTNRGALYGRLVFLAEGDASHLVTREGYERFTNPKQQPKFLQGIKQVLEFPPHVLEQRFGVGAEDGVAYEMLLRNGMLRGKRLHLNMGGFLYTNRQSLSIGLVVPADNLHEHFEGDPNLLMEWFLKLPALQHWFGDGKPGVFGAKIIRGGGIREAPTLIDNGLAIGGAASGIGIDFPYPNFTGPATAMGLLIAQAAKHIRDEGGDYSREQLRKHYLEPLQLTHYWDDVEFLRRWPAYVKKTKNFFGRNLDLTLQSTYLWTRSKQGFIKRWVKWIRLLLRTSGEWRDFREESRQLNHALHLNKIFPRPSVFRLLLDGTLNTLRDWFRRPRANLDDAGNTRFHYVIAGGAEPAGLPPALFRHWFSRFAPVLAGASKLVYSNNNVPLAQKLPQACNLLAKQVNLLDLLVAGVLGAATTLWSGIWFFWRRRRAKKDQAQQALVAPPQEVTAYDAAAHRAGDLTPYLAGATQEWEARLARLGYNTAAASHINVLWPQSLPDKGDIVKAGLWHVCPAHVYEARVSDTGQLQIVVNYENCIKCETCWRISDIVDWGRDGAHQFVYGVTSPATQKLLEEIDRAARVTPALPSVAGQSAGNGVFENAVDDALSDNTLSLAERGQLMQLSEKLLSKLREFETALHHEPRLIDHNRTEYLQMLARYAQQLARDMQSIIDNARQRHAAGKLSPAFETLTRAVAAAADKAEQRAAHVWHHKFSWAAADGRQIAYHHLAIIARCLDNAGVKSAQTGDPTSAWLQADFTRQREAETLTHIQKTLNREFPVNSWRVLEHSSELPQDQDEVLRQLVRELASPDVEEIHTHQRKILLAELGRRDPSLAYRVAGHLWAADIAARCGDDHETLRQSQKRWTEAEEWVGFGILDDEKQAYFLPAEHADRLLLLSGDKLLTVDPSSDNSGVRIKPLATMGLRGAGIARVIVANDFSNDSAVSVEESKVRRAWHIFAAMDLVVVALGMTDVLCRRCTEHAATRVQFPGLFHDEDSRDAIGKFGAVKKMLAEIAAKRFVLETMAHDLSPDDFSEAMEIRAVLCKALAAELLGSAPGSVTYNAGQIFGGTGYSEDDILSKYYRDAAAWRFLGPNNVTIYTARGAALLHGGEDELAFTTLPDEDELFTQITQRQALHAEFEEIRLHCQRVQRGVKSWREMHAALPLESETRAEFEEALGRQDAFLLASKAALLRTHSRLEHGLSSEIEVALLRVWLECAAAALDKFDAAVQRHLHLPAALEDRPIVDPSAGPPVVDYDDVLKHDRAYNSGDFLIERADPAEPRYVVEMVETDERLRRRNDDICSALEDQFAKSRDGLIYERFIEKEHRPTDDDLDFLRRRGFFRFPIAPEFGGEGTTKAEYYLLTTNAHRLSDIAVSLTIQVNSSLGTTPVLFAKNKDLPKARKDIDAFVADAALHAQIKNDLQTLFDAFAATDNGHAKKIESQFLALNKTLREKVFKRPAVRVLAHAFSRSWQQAADAGKQFQLTAMKSALESAVADWCSVCDRAVEFADELGRRVEAYDLFLRWVASGQISAFALTEPSAGSDTARVATRAKLKSVAVEVEDDGVLRFTPDGGKAPRYLLDARKIEFREEEDNGFKMPHAYYRWSEQQEPALIHFDDYDYETDDVKKGLYYHHGERRVDFTDVAQLRERNGKLFYDYWEMNGAKMWITNGRMCGIMCLYAKTDEGVTGFIVDRHAEGLLVGKDEEKMGQNGSPTNELSLQAVRVPRENVMGLEGRGQVNALETLNVGRAGIAMTCMTQMAPIIAYCRDFIAAQYNEAPPALAWRLQQMEEDRFIAEAVAFDVIGRFEHKLTKSIQLESAIAKMLSSELLHRLIETAEEIHGLPGQSQKYLIEKRKRDARVLNIYEGTNEIQRFLILRAIASDVGPRWKESQTTAPADGFAGREVLELENLKTSLRASADAALQLFGQQIWQNPNLQANCFFLSEAVAWLAAADSTLARLAWLNRRSIAADEEEPSPLIACGRRAFQRCAIEVRGSLKRFDAELVHLRRGFYAPEIRAASLLFEQAKETEPVQMPVSRVDRPMSILIVIEPPAPGVPAPVVFNGKLYEPYQVLRDADKAAVEIALRLRDCAERGCLISVIATGPASAAQPLRELASLGVDEVRLVVTPDSQSAAPDQLAAALVTTLAAHQEFDLILGGSGDGHSEEGLLVPLVAAGLSVPFAGSANQFAVQIHDEQGTVLLQGEQGQRSRALPACIAVTPALTLRSFTTDSYLHGLTRPIEMLPWPEDVGFSAATLLPQAITAASSDKAESPAALLPLEASALLLETAGLKEDAIASSPSGREDSLTAIDDVQTPFIASATDRDVCVVLAADGDGSLRSTAETTVDAAHFIAKLSGGNVNVILLAANDEAARQKTVAAIVEDIRADAVIVPLNDDYSDEIKSRVFVELWNKLNPRVAAVVGEPWTETAFLTLAGRALDSQRLLSRVVEVDGGREHLKISTARHGEHFRSEYQLDSPSRGLWLCLREDAVVGPLAHVQPSSPPRVECWRPTLDQFFGRDDIQRLLEELKQETGLLNLSEAEFIIDVGFGVGNRDGYEEVILPLEKALRDLGARGLMIGGSRKVTEELHLLPEDRQIGQSGVSVNPKILLAIGISGAPQHLNYIGGKATIISFNRDPEAPLMTLNQRQPQPRVFPVVGDLFETVPAFIAGLQRHDDPLLQSVRKDDVTTAVPDDVAKGGIY